MEKAPCVKTGSWVVSFLLSALHFNQYAEILWWNVWLLPKKNKCLERRKLPACRHTTWSFAGNWLKAATDGRKGPSETPWASLRLVFHQKTRRAEVKPLSPALCRCATHTCTCVLCCCFLCQLVVFTLSASWARSYTRGWRCSLTASLRAQKQWLRQKKKKKDAGWRK